MNALISLFEAPLDKPLELGGYCARLLGTQHERDAAFKLRSEVFGDANLVDLREFAHGLLVDEYDDGSLVFGVECGGEIVGTSRLTLPSPKGFLTEKLFDFVYPDIDRSRLGELGRLAISPHHRGGQRLPMLLLIAMTMRGMRHHELEWLYAFLAPKLADSYAMMGCTSYQLRLLPQRPETIARRRLMQGYFDRQQVGPVLFGLADVLRQLRSQ